MTFLVKSARIIPLENTMEYLLVMAAPGFLKGRSGEVGSIFAKQSPKEAV